jgi:hypothetical protein
MVRKKERSVKTKFRLTGPGDATFAKMEEKLTRLEDEGASDIHVSTIACWLDTLIGAQ